MLGNITAPRAPATYMLDDDRDNDDYECARCGIAIGLVEIEGIVLCGVCVKYPDLEECLERGKKRSRGAAARCDHHNR